MYTQQDLDTAKARTAQMYNNYLKQEKDYQNTKAILVLKRAKEKKEMDAAYKAYQDALAQEQKVYELVKNAISQANQQTYFETVELKDAATAEASTGSNTWVWVLVLVVVAVGGFFAYKKFKK